MRQEGAAGPAATATYGVNHIAMKLENGVFTEDFMGKRKRKSKQAGKAAAKAEKKQPKKRGK